MRTIAVHLVEANERMASPRIVEDLFIKSIPIATELAKVFHRF